MKVLFACGYYSDLANKINRRPEDYWNSYFFVWAVKVGAFKKAFYIINKDGNKHYINKENFHTVRPIFGQFIAGRFKEQGWDAGAWLVPVPSKDSLPGAPTSRSLRMLQEAMAPTTYPNHVLDAVCWTQQLPPAHLGGERKKDVLKGYLQVTKQMQGHRVVLVDDLVSRGGTMLATKEKLEEAGAVVLGAITCGRTIYDFDTKPFGRQEFELTGEAGDYGKIVG